MSLNVGRKKPMKLRAPGEHKDILCVPALSNAQQLLQANLAAAQSREHDFAGRSFAQLANDARRAFVTLACKYTRNYRDVETERGAAPEQPIIASGHQPELFHPGVWLKNFALGATAKRLNATAVNLIVDNDLCREAAIRVPGGTPQMPTIQPIPFDLPADPASFERRTIQNRESLESFPTRVMDEMSGLVEPDLLNEYWPRVVEASKNCPNLGLCLAQARHQQEATWGLQTLELPLSSVCDTEPFLWFAACLMTRLPELHSTYNDAVHAFRLSFRIRSRTRPVPDLVRTGNSLESPFWLLPAEQTRRQPLFVEAKKGKLVLSAGRESRFSLDFRSDGDVESIVTQLFDLREQGIAIRPRALATTMFIRLFLCDLFIHGVGGANYDRLTDELIRRLLGFEPPQLITVSGTYRLDVPYESVSAADLSQAAVRLRELEYHPERFIGAIDANTEAGQLIAAKQRWIQQWPTVKDRKAAHNDVCRINAALQPFLANERRRCELELHRLQTGYRHQQVLASREYAFCLHRAEPLRDWLTGV